MADQQHVSINLDHVLELLRSGVRRADVFMGIGLNAAIHDPPISRLLAAGGQHNIRLVKENLTPEERAHVAAEFGKGVRANGLRELIETFSIFLDRLYLPLLLMNKRADGKNERLSSPDRFERMSLLGMSLSRRRYSGVFWNKAALCWFGSWNERGHFRSGPSWFLKSRISRKSVCPSFPSGNVFCRGPSKSHGKRGFLKLSTTLSA